MCSVRCGFGGMLVQNPHFLPHFQLLLPISWKIVPYYNCIGGKFMLYYICISVSKNRQGRFSGLLSAGWHGGFGGQGSKNVPRGRRLLHAPPACPRILGRAAIPCRMQPDFGGTMRRPYFIIIGGRLVFCLPKLSGSLRGGGALP